jgi:hypothetical protein
LQTPLYYRKPVYRQHTPFVGAGLKIKRAKRHLAELADAARNLPRLRGYQFMVDTKPKDGKLKIMYLAPSPMPLEFSGALGDAVHNLRTAFDHIAIALSTPPIGTGNPKNTYFPTGINRDEFEAELRRKMKGASPEALRLVEELEPYDGGKNSIRALHDLDILDKHKLLVPTLSLLHVQRMSVFLGEKEISLGGTDFQADESGTEFVAMIESPGEAELKFGQNFDATFEIVFGKGQPFEGQSIMPALLQLADVAKSFLQACEAGFLPPGAPTASSLGLI